MSDVRGDVLAVLAALAVPLGFAVAFPREAVGFAGARGEERPSAPTAAIVFLDSDAAVRAVRAAKILPRNEGDGMVYADLLAVELPDPGQSPALAIGSRRRPPAPSVIERGIPPFLPSRRAAAPVRIPAEKGRDDLPFPRSELLKLN